MTNLFKKLMLPALAALFGCTAQAQTQTQAQERTPVYPDRQWHVAEPEDHGFDKLKLDRVRRYVIDSLHTTGMMIVVGGEVIFEYGNLEQVSYIASCRKSVLAMMLGKYVENGTIDLGTTIEQLGIDDIGGLLPVERKATIDHLVTSRSGIYHDASNGGDDAGDRPKRGSKKPGAYYLYNNWDFNAAGAIFEQLTGRSIYETLRDDIALPIGMQDFDMAKQRKSGRLDLSKFPAYHIYLSTRDMARLGYLMLRKGNWCGRQVISRAWAEKIVGVVTPLKEMNPASRRNIFEYGYMWWLFKVDDPLFKGAYTARGSMGQYITVIPELDMVIAHKTDSVYGRSTAWNKYYKAVRAITKARLQ